MSVSPKSLQQLIDGLSSEQQTYVLAVRDRLLSFDERMAEVGLTTRTFYGLRKGSKDIYQSKLCAEFIPWLPGVLRPRLRLLLPYAKREFGAPGRTYKPERVKGLTWVEVSHEQQWNPDTAIRLLFYLGKSNTRYSYSYDLEQYSSLYEHLTGQKQSLHSLDDVVSLGLEEWLLRLNSAAAESLGQLNSP